MYRNKITASDLRRNRNRNPELQRQANRAEAFTRRVIPHVASNYDILCYASYASPCVPRFPRSRPTI